MKKIDAYSVDLNKALAFIFASILITLLSIWGFIVPMMKSYKISKITNRHAKIKFTNTNKYYKERVAELQNLSKENRAIIESLRKKFDKQNFKIASSKNMSDLKIEYQKPKDYGVYFNETDILVEGVIPAPKNFFDTILELNNYTNMVAIDFPIKIETVENRNLKVSYPLKLYTTKELNATYKIQEK